MLQSLSTSLLRNVTRRPNVFARNFRATPLRFADDRGVSPAGGQNLTLNFATPSESIINNQSVYMCSIPATSGVMGILGEHAPTIAQLMPGVVTVHGNDVNDITHQYFVSSGFALVKSDSSCQVNVVEAIPLEDLDLGQARSALEKYKEELNRAANDEERAKADIAIEVCENVIATLEQK